MLKQKVFLNILKNAGEKGLSLEEIKHAMKQKTNSATYSMICRMTRKGASIKLKNHRYCLTGGVDQQTKTYKRGPYRPRVTTQANGNGDPELTRFMNEVLSVPMEDRETFLGLLKQKILYEKYNEAFLRTNKLVDLIKKELRALCE